MWVVSHVHGGSQCDQRSDEDCESQGSSSQGKRATEGQAEGDDSQA